MIRLHTFFTVLLVSIFFLLISIPPVAFFIQDKRKISTVENRTLAVKPELPMDVHSLLEFPQAFEDYYNDHFGFRNSFLEMYALGKRFIGDSLGVNIGAGGEITSNVIRGKEGWYFLNRVWDGDPLSDYRNLDLYSRSELLRAGLGIAARRHWLEKQGIKYLLFFAPNKHTIYSEYMPDYIVKQGDVSSMDQLYGFLAKYTPIQFVDLRDPIIRGKAVAREYWKDEDKDEARLYWKTDSHWNGAGTDIAQYAVARKMEEMLPGMIGPRQRDKDDFQMVQIKGDLASLMNDKSLYSERSPVVRQGTCADASPEEYGQRHQVTTCREGKVSALIYHDSFFTGSLKPHFADYFSTTVFTWERLNQESLRKNIAEYKPAIIIEELAERFLPYIPDISGETYDDFWREVFGRSRPVYRLDGRKVSKGKKGSDFVNAAVQYDGLKDIVEVEALNSDPQLYLNDIFFNADQLYILKVEIEAPVPTPLQIFYSRRGEEEKFPSGENSQTYGLEKGFNTLFIPLLSGDLASRLRLDPGKAEGKYVIKDLAMRLVEETSLP
ncbi:MAG: hypothetical protein SCH71_07195 [Desulfobulbaceae bacterium]|nr:hypothetical protein [Desulfobulbaceae bacterium]